MIIGKSENIPAQLASLFSRELKGQLVALRRDIHRHPELSFQEERTANLLSNELKKLNPDRLEILSRTAVIGKMPGKNPKAPVVAIRADIDALPIQEATGLDFSSIHPGVMHACGHDVHAAWGFGAASLLARNPAEGPVAIIFQPAEEIGKGALGIIKAGVLKGISAIFGAHVDRRLPVGQVIAQDGPLAASTDTFEIELIGKGAHGARPHEAQDPVVAAAAIVTALQTIVSRKLNPARAAVVTVGSLHTGNAPNVIPERATMSGTLRAVDPETRLLLKTEIKQIVESIANAHKIKVKVTIEDGTPPVVNPRGPHEWARQAATTLLGDTSLVPLPTLNMAGEDFAYYLEKIPGCFLRIGACEKGGKPIPSHSPQFYAAEESIFVGAAVLAETARIASRYFASLH